MSKKKSAASYIIIICLIYMSSFMIVSPSRSMEAAENSLLLCGKVVIPSLFPFIFCANMFIALGLASIMNKYVSKIMYPLFGVSGAGGLAFILGITSGYPVGASCAAALYQTGECTKTEAERLLSFCNNSGPMFIIGSIGVGMLKSYKIGVFLYIIHIVASFICGLIFKLYGKTQKNNLLHISRDESNIQDLSSDIADALTQSVNTIIKICAFVIIFAVFTAVLPDTAYKVYLYPFFEITGGINALISNTAKSLTLPLVSAFLSFSGLSVMAQVSSIITPAGLSIKPYIIGKCIQSFFSFILTFIFIKFFPAYVNVFSLIEEYNIFTFTPKELICQSLTGIIFSVVFVLVLIILLKFTDNK